MVGDELQCELCRVGVHSIFLSLFLSPQLLYPQIPLGGYNKLANIVERKQGCSWRLGIW